MDIRRLGSILLISIAAAIVGSALGDRLSVLSEAGWWHALPWVLLVVFWSGLGLHLWRQRQRQRRPS